MDAFRIEEIERVIQRIEQRRTKLEQLEERHAELAKQIGAEKWRTQQDQHRLTRLHKGENVWESDLDQSEIRD